MRIETITYKRTKNLGNFQNETLEVTASLEKEDLPDEVATNLRLFVENQLYPPKSVEKASPPDNF
ncbi:MAG: hypothetical protein RMY62_014745 [Nostoc sp. ZfuVER08]|nr:hypothetical protein [Nostoc sp. ZfuVER08]